MLAGFYAINTNWDLDKDGYCGESIEDISIFKNKTLNSMFKLGRIPFNDAYTVKSILQHTIKKEKEYKQKTNKPRALIAAGIISFSPLIDGAKFTDKLKNNLIKSYTKITTLNEREGVEFSKYKPNYQLNRKNFKKEWNAGYDFICTEAHGGVDRYFWKKDSNKNGIFDETEASFEEFFVEKDLIKSNGFLIMSGCATSIVESDRYNYDGVQIPRLLKNNLIAAGVGTTKSIVYNCDSLSYSLLPFWDNNSKTYGDCFYKAINNMFINFKFNEDEKYDFYHNLYSYCYIGDPSFKVPKAGK